MGAPVSAIIVMVLECRCTFEGWLRGFASHSHVNNDGFDREGGLRDNRPLFNGASKGTNDKSGRKNNR